jgi:lipopolysaccharide transport system permease protein
MTIVFTIIFGRFAKLPSDGVPYSYCFCRTHGSFANSFTEASTSIANATMLSKVYFPRIIIPASSVVVSFIDLLIYFAIMIGIYIGISLYGLASDILPLFIL